MEVLEAIKTRRSIRRYKSTPVDDKSLETIFGSRSLGAVLEKYPVLEIYRGS